MSYSQYPERGSVNLAMNDHSVKLDFDVTCEKVPPKIHQWLLDVGWSLGPQDPNTYEQLFKKEDEPATDFMYYRWHEAVAYENWKFMTLADGQNET